MAMYCIVYGLIADSSSYAQNKGFLEYTGMLAAVASIQIRNTDHQNVSRPKMSWLHSFGLIRDESWLLSTHISKKNTQKTHLSTYFVSLIKSFQLSETSHHHVLPLHKRINKATQEIYDSHRFNIYIQYSI